jgi:predicted MFS family arabinose efflux permease
LTDLECGTLYSLAAGLTFFYGLFFSGYLIDNAGVKPCMLLGSLFLSVARFLACIIETKRDLYLIFTTIIPLGLSLCKNNYETR